MKLENNLEETTISVEEAMERTTLWRDVFMDTFEVTDPSKVIRGFRIPIQDIQKLATDYSALNIAYVRAYLSAEQQEMSNGEGPYKFTIILVPVDGADKDILTHTVAGETKSSIYDFTQPCPPCCDINSPLYSGLKGGE